MTTVSTLRSSGAPCPMRDLLPAYINGTLGQAGADGPTLGDIATHLHICAACQEEHAAWVAIAVGVRVMAQTPKVGRLDAVSAALDDARMAPEQTGMRQYPRAMDRRSPSMAPVGAVPLPRSGPNGRRWSP